MKHISLTLRSHRATVFIALTLILLNAQTGPVAAGMPALPSARHRHTSNDGPASSPGNHMLRYSRSASSAPAIATITSADLYAYAVPSLYYVPSGGTFNYLIYIGNGGPDMAQDASVSGLLPPSISVNSVSADYGSCSTSGNTDGSTNLNCSLGNIALYESRTVTVTVSPTGTQYAVLTAGFEATSSSLDANSYNNTTTVGVRIAAPPLPTPTPATGDNPLVAFVEASAEIYAVGSDGTGRTNLTNNPVDEEVFEWSPDGTRLAFVRYDNQTWEDNIFVMDADGTNQTQLTGVPDDHFYDPAWSPDGTLIAFSRYVSAEGESVIGLMNADGTGQVTLTGGTNTYDHGPRWSPDGSRIAFVRYDPNEGAGNVFVMDADGSNLSNLTQDASYNFEPQWSHDGTRIAFVSFRDGNAEIYLMNSDGTQQSNLTQSSDWDYSPRWSPDGSKLAFHRMHNGGSGLYIVEADGNGLVHVGDDIEYNSEPDWSPDGMRLAFATARNGSGAINLVNADGSGRVELVNCQYTCSNPRWQRLAPPD